MATGGSIAGLSIGGREFAATADADTTRKLGGTENDVQANGDGTSRKIKTRVPPSITGVVVSCDDDRGDHEYLQGIADSNGFTPVTVEYASGDIYQGLATITGELSYSSQNATCAFDLMGQGTFTKQ